MLTKPKKKDVRSDAGDCAIGKLEGGDLPEERSSRCVKKK